MKQSIITILVLACSMMTAQAQQMFRPQDKAVITEWLKTDYKKAPAEAKQLAKVYYKTLISLVEIHIEEVNKIIEENNKIFANMHNPILEIQTIDNSRYYKTQMIIANFKSEVIRIFPNEDARVRTRNFFISYGRTMQGVLECLKMQLQQEVQKPTSIPNVENLKQMAQEKLNNLLETKKFLQSIKNLL